MVALQNRGVPDLLPWSFCTMNAFESLIGARKNPSRRILRWRSKKMGCRLVGDESS